MILRRPYDDAVDDRNRIARELADQMPEHREELIVLLQRRRHADQAQQHLAGPMLGDPVFSGVQNEIRSALHSVVNTGSSVYNTLASVGITSQSDGTLSLNKFKLQTALSTAPTAVSSLFSSTNGVAAIHLPVRLGWIAP